MLRRVAEQAESELGARDLVVVVGDVAMEALAGRDTIELAPDASTDEAIVSIKVRLQGG